MKKSLFLFMSCLVFSFPALVAQVQEQTEAVPAEVLVLKKGNIPPAVLKTAEELFKESTQVKWGMFPYQLKDYGWVVNEDYNEPINHYEILFKTKNGIDVDAVFEASGELIRYREVNKNATLPPVIMQAIGKTPYKGWKVTSGTEVVKDNQKKIVEHYIVRLDNGKQKKTLYFTREGNTLTNK